MLFIDLYLKLICFSITKCFHFNLIHINILVRLFEKGKIMIR